MFLDPLLGWLALLSLGLTLWQWLAGRRFPLHQRIETPTQAPPITLLKPLKGWDSSTEACLRSWLTQRYPGKIQVLFGVASPDDPVCPVVRGLLSEFPDVDAQLLVCGPLKGANLKVAQLVQLEHLAKYPIISISDADVQVTADFLANAVVPLSRPEVGLVNCFYRLANPSTLAMQWEAIAINADFWSQVLQSQMIKALDFALGAVMITRRQLLTDIGGFAALVDCLADDYQLGHRIARRGYRIMLCPVVVECQADPMSWTQVWKHQLRWARTIRVCQPLPYFFSLLSNATLWPLVWLLLAPSKASLAFALCSWLARVGTALDLKARLEEAPVRLASGGLVLLKDLFQVCLWALAFVGNRVEWRGEKIRLRKDGTLVRSH